MSRHEDNKRHVRISPLLLGKIGDLAAAGSHGASIVQFAGQCVTYNDGAEWHVTHAVVSNSLEVLEPAARAAHNRSVEELVKANNLTHVGWLRQASAACPLSSLDMDTQRVYQAHVTDAFAAMLDISTDSEKGPCLYFYCLAGPPHDLSRTFIPAHHVILDSSVPFTLIPCHSTTAAKASPVSAATPPAPEMQQQQRRDARTTTSASCDVGAASHAATCATYSGSTGSGDDGDVDESNTSTRSRASLADLSHRGSARESMDVVRTSTGALQLTDSDYRMLEC